jgi:hypothetical protein
LAKARDEVETGRRDRHQLALSVAAGQSIRNDVRGARPVLHSKIKAQQLPDRGEALVEEVAVVVRLDDEAPPPEVRPPVSDRLDQSDELALVGRQCLVTRSDGTAEECHRVALLDEHGAKPVRRRITLNHEGLGEVGHGEDRRRGDGGLESAKSRRRLVIPGEAVFLEKVP